MVNKIVVFYLVSVFSSIAFHLYTKGDVEEKKEEILKPSNEKQVIKEQKIEENKVKLTEEIITKNELSTNNSFKLILPDIDKNNLLKYVANNNFMNSYDFHNRNSEIVNSLNQDETKINFEYLKLLDRDCFKQLSSNNHSCLLVDYKNKMLFTISLVQFYSSQENAKNDLLNYSYAIQLFFKNDNNIWNTATVSGLYNEDKNLYSSNIAFLKKKLDFSKFNKYLDSSKIPPNINTDKLKNFINKEKKGIFPNDNFVDTVILENYKNDLEKIND